MDLSTTTGSYFDSCREGIDELLETHTNMRVIEGTIDTYALVQEEKDALWLWARGRCGRLVRVASTPPSLASRGSHD